MIDKTDKKVKKGKNTNNKRNINKMKIKLKKYLKQHKILFKKMS